MSFQYLKHVNILNNNKAIGLICKMNKPGGPYKRTPFGGSIPRFTKRSGLRRGTSRTYNVSVEILRVFLVSSFSPTYLSELI